MKKNIGIILGTAMAMQSCSTVKVMRNEKCYEPIPEKKNTYTEFRPNPDNNEYRKKFLGVRITNFKKR